MYIIEKNITLNQLEKILLFNGFEQYNRIKYRLTFNKGSKYFIKFNNGFYSVGCEGLYLKHNDFNGEIIRFINANFQLKKPLKIKTPKVIALISI